jgi:predicted  nucleic acid-binding Zn-ribbon protein
MKELSMKNKESYLQKLANQLQQRDAEIVELKAKADKVATESKSELFLQIDELREKTETARNKLKQLQTAEDGAWEDVKAGVEKSWEELKGAFSKASARFK